MINIQVKRIRGNRSVVHGRLSIPRLGFSCYTLELREPTDLMYKFNCSIPEGNYVMKTGYDQRSAMYPVFKYKPVGYSKKPSLSLENGDYMHLATGDIALGDSIVSEWEIGQSGKFKETVRNVMHKICMSNEIIVLTVCKSKKYAFSYDCYEDQINDLDAIDFFNEADDEEPIELENNEQSGE